MPKFEVTIRPQPIFQYWVIAPDKEEACDIAAERFEEEADASDITGCSREVDCREMTDAQAQEVYESDWIGEEEDVEED